MICELLQTWNSVNGLPQVETLLEEGLKSQRYAPLVSSCPQLLTVAEVLDKYRETSGNLLGRGTKQVLPRGIRGTPSCIITSACIPL